MCAILFLDDLFSIILLLLEYSIIFVSDRFFGWLRIFVTATKFEKDYYARKQNKIGVRSRELGLPEMSGIPKCNMVSYAAEYNLSLLYT
jgi:hypothetical protein